MTKPKDTLSELRQQRADVKRRLDEVSLTLQTLQAELAMTDYRIASHQDYKPQVQRPIMYEDFMFGLNGRPKSGKTKPTPVIRDEDLDF
jgi:hypothetical protein